MEPQLQAAFPVGREHRVAPKDLMERDKLRTEARQAFGAPVSSEGSSEGWEHEVEPDRKPVPVR